MADYLTDEVVPLSNDANIDGKKYVRKNTKWDHISFDYNDLPDKPSIDGKTLYPGSTSDELGLEKSSDSGSNSSLETDNKTTLVDAINELNRKKANKIQYPHIEWISDLQQVPLIPIGRVLQFDTSKVPIFSVVSPVMGVAFIQCAEINDGETGSGFGPYMTSDGIWHYGYFHVGDTIIPVVDVWRDGIWLDPDEIGIGKYIIRFGFLTGFINYLGSGVMTGFSTVTDIIVSDIPDIDLSQLKTQIDGKQNRIYAGRNIAITEHDPLHPVISGTTTIPAVSLDPGLSADAKATADQIASAVTELQAYDQMQDQKIQTLNGHYYPLDAYNFGHTLDVKTPNPTDVAALNTYAMTMEGVSSITDIIDGTVIKNLFDGVEFVWNSIDQIWVDWDIGNIATASNDHLGVIEGTPDPGDGSADGFGTVISGGKIKTIGFLELKDRIANMETGKVSVQQNPEYEGKDLVIGQDGIVAPGTSEATSEALANALEAINKLINKVDKIEGKGLSSNDFTENYKAKIDLLTGEVKVFNDEVTYTVDDHEDILLKRYMMTSDLRTANSFMEVSFDNLIFRIFNSTAGGNLRADIATTSGEITATVRNNTFYNATVEGGTYQNEKFTENYKTIDSSIYINSNNYSIYEIMVYNHWWEINLWCANAKEKVMMSLERRF
jgi:hypothetical protein